ncbi:MAG: hypothetical protein FWB94_11415 [Chitinispirillia bacterium]|nr:hypothetical protein [Chitinispirillia bacterium]
MKKLVLCVVGVVFVLLFAVGEANAAKLNFGAADVIGVIKDRALEGPKAQFGMYKPDLTGVEQQKGGGWLIIVVIAVIVIAGAAVIFFIRKNAVGRREDDDDDFPDVDLDDD